LCESYGAWHVIRGGRIMITTTLNSPWVFDSTSSCTNTNVVIPDSNQPIQAPKRQFCLKRVSLNEDDFCILTFDSNLLVTFTSLSFTCTAKFVEATVSNSTLAVAATVRGKQVDNESHTFQYSFQFQNAVPHDTLVLKLLRLKKPNEIKLSLMQASLTTSEPQKVQKTKTTRSPSKWGDGVGSGGGGGGGGGIASMGGAGGGAQMKLLLMTMQQQVATLINDFRKDVDKRFDQLDERVKRLEEEHKK